MTFDPLDLFSAPIQAEAVQSDESETYLRQVNSLQDHSFSDKPHEDGTAKDQHQINDLTTNLDENDMIDIPLHVHDLPLLQLKPPLSVLLLFLNLFAPDQVLNFAPLDPETDPETIFAQKNAQLYIDSALSWLQLYSMRFTTRSLLAPVSYLAETLRKGSMAEYNAWLTQIIASELNWLDSEDTETIKHLAALRLAENCGRTAHPEILRVIEVPHLSRNLQLKEPSLTSDNLGLKTWGSSFLLGSRLANPKLKGAYLKSPVLELGSGTGLVGMISCILGYKTTLTDLAEIVPNLRDNVELNGVEADVAELDWLNPASFVDRYPQRKYSTIILSDPLYSSKHPQWIVDMINQFLADEDAACVLFQVPVRRNFENERATLWQLLEEHHYEILEEDIEQGRDDFGESDFIFKKYKRSL